MKKIVFLFILLGLTITAISYDLKEDDKTTKVASLSEPKECKDYDVVTIVHSCSKGFVCEVSLRSGLKIKMKSPIIGEAIPCKN